MLQGLATDLTVQPDAGEGPVRLDSLLRDREGFSSLLDRQSTEVSQLNDTRLAGIQFFQTFESRMDCQQFIRLMGGEIRLASEAGKGSVFYFEIPVRPHAQISR